jgi:hypothetical protein
MVTTLPSWSTAPVFRNLRIGELAMTRVCGGRRAPRQARLLARVCVSAAEPGGREGVPAGAFSRAHAYRLRGPVLAIAALVGLAPLAAAAPPAAVQSVTVVGNALRVTLSDGTVLAQ